MKPGSESRYTATDIDKLPPTGKDVGICEVFMEIGRVSQYIAFIALCWHPTDGLAQPARAGRLAERIAGAIRIDPASAVAYVGQPYGVGHITVSPPANLEGLAIDRQAFALRERHGRVHFPVFSTGTVIRFVRNLIGRREYQAGDPIDVWFLFEGSAPLDIELFAHETRRYRISPQRNHRSHQVELQRWWSTYTAHAKQRAESGDYPPLAEIYLLQTLARKCGKRPTELVTPARVGSPRNALALAFGSETQHLEKLTELLSEKSICGTPADRRAPPNLQWDPLPATDYPADTEFEPIASRVPEECFYIRFGSFANFRWFRRVMREQGGDLSRLISLRGHDNGADERLEQQLAIKESVLADLLGGQVISDVALIGRDFYLTEGGAIGIVFETRLPLLGQDIRRQRRATLNAMASVGAKDETIERHGYSVSYLHTPDNRLRSYYVEQGRYHLVTNSEWIVDHFLRTETDGKSLAQTDEFRAIRSVHAHDAPDAAWIYLSSRFLAGLFDAPYQIELQRRLHALAEMEILLLAQFAAGQGTDPSPDIPQLIKTGWLPPRFGERSDGSSVITTEDDWRDSSRGARGFFTPIPDVDVTEVSQREADWYASYTGELARSWRRLDPIMVALRREENAGQVPGSEARERLVAEIRMLPFQRFKFSPWIDMLGPPSLTVMQPADADVVFVDVVLKSDGSIPPDHGQHLFLGVQDAPPQLELAEGRILRSMQLFSQVPAYLGGWPKPGWLDRLPWVRRAQPDLSGMVRLPSGLWRYQSPEGMAMVSFHRDVLARSIGNVLPVATDRPAQIRFRVGDLSTSALREWTHDREYDRARRASVGNAHLLHTICQQFHVPRPQAHEIVQRLLNVELICPLGGEYVLHKAPNGLEYWTSTAWQHPPQRYTPPLLAWFRGAEGEVIVDGDRLHASVVIDMLPLDKLRIARNDAPPSLHRPPPERAPSSPGNRQRTEPDNSPPDVPQPEP